MKKFMYLIIFSLIFLVSCQSARLITEENMEYKTKNGYKIYKIVEKGSNVFLIKYNGKNIIIDAGKKSQRETLDKNLDSLGVNKVDYLILTHTHYDHVQNANHIKTEYDAKVVVHESEAQFLREGNTPLPKGTILLTKIIKGTLGWLGQMILTYEPCESDITIGKSLTLPDDDLNIYIIHTPGHCIGSVTIVADDEVAFTGDTLVKNPGGSIFSWYADDEDLMVENWKTVIDTGALICLGGHGGSIDMNEVIEEYDKRVE